MIESVVTVEQALGKATDFDVLPDGTWAGVFERENGTFLVSSRGTEFHAGASTTGSLVRFIDRNHVVVVRRRGEPNERQSFIARLDGSGRIPFAAGDGVEDVIVLGDLIAVTYFDEGVFSGVPPSAEGIAFFDFEGELFAGYRSMFGSDAVDIADCYAACRVDRDTLGFAAYPDFELVRVDPRGRQQWKEPLPHDLNGAAAVTFQEDRVFLFSPYATKCSILECRNRASHEIGRHEGPLRGLENGRFLFIGDHGFATITCGQPGSPCPKVN